MQPVRLFFVFYDIKSKWISHRHSCNVFYAGSPLPHDLEQLRTTMQRRVVDFVRVGYFIPFNGPLNGHPPNFTNVVVGKNATSNLINKTVWP